MAASARVDDCSDHCTSYRLTYQYIPQLAPGLGTVGFLPRTRKNLTFR